ncbi:MAG: retention module-containing protein, partial [Gammaproteobacteria bacterium]
MATKIVGYVVDLTGSAQVRSAEGVIKVLNIGDNVNERDLLITGDAANVVISFYSGQKLQVAGNEEVLLDETVYAEESSYTDEQVDELASLQQALIALQQAIIEGQDVDQLESTAAGKNTGSPEALQQASTYERDGREGEVETRLTDFSVQSKDIDNQFNGDDDVLLNVKADTRPDTIPAPISVTTAVPTITVTANDVVEESVTVGDVIATFSSSSVDTDALSHQLTNDPDGYFSINGTDIELTANGVAAINDDTLNLDSLTIQVEVSNGVDSTIGSDISNITRISDVSPVAAGDSYMTDEDTVLTVNLSSDLLVNDSDLDGDSLTISTNPIVDVSNGTLTLNPDGTFNYTPDASFHGTDSFVYEVRDSNGDTAQATVSIHVNPVTDISATDDTASGDEDTTISSSVASNDNTTSGGVLTYAIDTGVSNGSLVFNGDGSYDYTPNANFSGTDSFIYTVTDAASGENSTQTVTLTVNQVTDLSAADDVAGGSEGTIISSTVATNDNTTSGGVLTYAVDTGVTNGSLVFNSDGSYDYTPNANFVGTDSFTYTVTDADSGESSTQTVSLTVNPVTDLSAADDVASGDEDTTISSTVAANDSTTSGGVLTYAVDTGVSNGSLVFNSDGSYDYTPNANFSGTDSFTYTVTDAASGESLTQTVSLTINPVTDLTAADDAASGAEDTTISSTVAANDSTTSGG